jgi:predicted ArsR family transcriptional regulator
MQAREASVDLHHTPDDDVLSHPVRARLFRALAALRRPATTQELADLSGRHPNSVREQLQRLASHRLIERRRRAQPLGRPQDEWVIAPGAQPGGRAPEAYSDLGRWLARALQRDPDRLEAVEAVGREVGRELAPEMQYGSPAQLLADAFTALGFAPRTETPAPGHRRYVLGNCPYREAVRENQPVVCTLHRGITQGLLDKLDPGAKLAGFVARDPFEAGCLIDIQAAARAG